MKFRTGCVAVGFLSLVLSLSAQTFTSLVSFNGSNGAPGIHVPRPGYGR